MPWLQPKPDQQGLSAASEAKVQQGMVSLAIEEWPQAAELISNYVDNRTPVSTESQAGALQRDREGMMMTMRKQPLTASM
jgi:hypothetical protein